MQTALIFVLLNVINEKHVLDLITPQHILEIRVECILYLKMKVQDLDMLTLEEITEVGVLKKVTRQSLASLIYIPVFFRSKFSKYY